MGLGCSDGADDRYTEPLCVFGGAAGLVYFKPVAVEYFMVVTFFQHKPCTYIKEKHSVVNIVLNVSKSIVFNIFVIKHGVLLSIMAC